MGLCLLGGGGSGVYVRVCVSKACIVGDMGGDAPVSAKGGAKLLQSCTGSAAHGANRVVKVCKEERQQLGLKDSGALYNKTAKRGAHIVASGG